MGVNEEVSEGVRLLNSWQQGDIRAGDQFYRSHGAPIKHYFRRRVALIDDVADLVQETFLRCQRAEFRGEGSPRAFLFGIAHRVLLEYLRRIQKTAARDNELLDRSMAELSHDPDYVLDQKRATRLLMKAMRRIPLRYQLVLELSRWENLTQIEIASILSSQSPIPASTVGRWKSEAIDALEAKMLELASSSELREVTTMTITSWRCWAVDEARQFRRTSSPRDARR